MKKFVLIGWLLTNALLVQATEIVSDKIPSTAKTMAEFVPTGWEIEQKVEADLTNDKIADVVLELRQAKNADPDAEIARQLVVLTRSANKIFFKVGVGKQLLLCPSCFGMLGSGENGEGNAEIKISKGVLIVDQLIGSRESQESLYRFRYDTKTRRMVLIGKDTTNVDRATGDASRVSINYLTGLQVTDVFKNEKTISSKKKTISVKTSYLEDVVNQ